MRRNFRRYFASRSKVDEKLVGAPPKKRESWRRSSGNSVTLDKYNSGSPLDEKETSFFLCFPTEAQEQKKSVGAILTEDFGVPVTSDVESATHLIIYVTKTSFQQKAMMKILSNWPISKQQNIIVLSHCYDEYATNPVAPLICLVPTRFSWLKQIEWIRWRSDRVKLYHHAAIETALCAVQLRSREYVRFDVFLSHKQSNDQNRANVLYTKLTEKYKYRVWLDVAVHDLSLTGMRQGVQASDNFVLFASRGVFESFYCQQEIQEAFLHRRNIVVVYDEDARFGNATESKAREELCTVRDETNDQNLKRALNQVEISQWKRFDIRTTRDEDNFMIQLLRACRLDRELMTKLGSRVTCVDRKRIGRENAQLFCEGTREWILNDVTNWFKSEQSTRPVYVLLANAGVGKSTLSGELCRRGNSEIVVLGKPTSTNYISVVAYHFFSHDDEKLKSALQCILSILEQLRTNVPGFIAVSDAVINGIDCDSIESMSLQHLIKELIAKPCKDLPKESCVPGLIVIDAVDECDQAVEFMRIVQESWKRLVPEWLKLFVTSRPTTLSIPSTGTEHRMQSIHILNTENESNIADIKLYLRHRVFHDENTSDAIVEAVANKTQGFFLYLKFLEDIIHSALGSTDRRLTLSDIENFPDGLTGLGGVYEEYFQRIYDTVGSETYGLLFAPLIAQREPVPQEIWRIAVGYSQSNKSKRVDQNDKQRNLFEAIQQCSSLVNIPKESDESDSVLEIEVRFVHKSMVDWLSNGLHSANDNAIKAGRKHLSVNVYEGHAKLATVFKDILLNKIGSPAVLGYARKHLVYHSINLDKQQNVEADELSILELVQNFFQLDYLLQRSNFEQDDFLGVREDVQLLLDKMTSESIKSDLCVLEKLFRISHNALTNDHRELASQIIGRIPQSTGMVKLLQNLWAQARDFEPEGNVKWLRPLKPALNSAVPSELVSILHGPSDWVLSVAFSPNGKHHVATGCANGIVQVWDIDANAEICDPMEGHSESVTAVVYAFDGSKIVSGSRDKSIRIWDAINGHQLGKVLTGHADAITSLAYSPIKHEIVSGSSDDTVCIWNTESYQLVGSPMCGHTQSVKSVAYSPNGKFVASGSNDSTIRIWDAETLKEARPPLRGHKEGVKSVAYSKCGSRIASGSFDKTIRLWDTKTGLQFVKPLTGHEEVVTCVVFTEDGRFVISGSDDKTIRIWDANNGLQQSIPFRGHTASIASITVSRDGKHVVSGGRDKVMCLWDLSKQQAIHNTTGGEVVKVHQTAVSCVVFSQDGKLIATSSQDRTILVWDSDNGNVVWNTVHGPNGNIHKLLFTPDSRRIIAVCTNKSIWSWDIGFLEPTQAMVTHSHLIHDADVSHDSQYFVFGSLDKSVYIWDLVTCDKVHGPMVGHKKRVNVVAYSPKGDRIVSGSWDNTVRIWSTALGKQLGATLRGHSMPVISVSFSPDGHHVVSGSRDHSIRLWDVEDFQEDEEVETVGQCEATKVFNGHTDSITMVKFATIGNYVLSFSWDNTMRVWDTDTGEEMYTGWLIPDSILNLFQGTTLPILPLSTTLKVGNEDSIGFTSDTCTHQDKRLLYVSPQGSVSFAVIEHSKVHILHRTPN